MKIDKKQLFEKIMKSVNKAILKEEKGKDWKTLDYDKRQAFAAEKLQDLEDSKKKLEDSQIEFEEKMEDSVEFFKELEDENKEMSKAMMDMGVDKEDQLISPEKIKDTTDAEAPVEPEPEPVPAGGTGETRTSFEPLTPGETASGIAKPTTPGPPPGAVGGPAATPDVSAPDTTPPSKRDDEKKKAKNYTNLKELMYTFKEWYEEG
jgi:hypothetical protein